MSSEPTILLVEDHPGDVRLAREALRESGFRGTLAVASDGVEARDRLQRGRRPHLVLLDLNRPRMLAGLKGDRALRSIPVVVLSSSEAEQDIRCTYQLHANARS